MYRNGEGSVIEQIKMIHMVLWYEGGRGLASIGETRGAEWHIPEIDAAVGDELE